MLNLEPGVGLITGGASGMGAAVCQLLQREGCRVASLDPNHGGPADLELICDVSDDAALDAAYARVVDELGSPRYVFAGAGVSGMAPFLDLDASEWDRVMDVNLRSVYRTVWVAARGMVAAGIPGCIVVNSSSAGRVADTGFAHYSVAKTGLRQLVRVAARELAPHGVRVNGVAPGFTITGLTAGAAEIPGFLETAAQRVPLGRVGQPDDIADVVGALFALGWVTGETVSADGGQNLNGPNQPQSPV
jgi:NAD(P)-dependent dehydrogenase (short-subunit alcohol dehydrogenase family)